jgi:hypothetical protein
MVVAQTCLRWSTSYCPCKNALKINGFQGFFYSLANKLNHSLLNSSGFDSFPAFTASLSEHVIKVLR